MKNSIWVMLLITNGLFAQTGDFIVDVLVNPNLDKPEPNRNKSVTFFHGIIDNST